MTDDELIERMAQAAYDRELAIGRWRGLPEARKQEWLLDMRAALAAVAPLIAAAERERCWKIATELEVPTHLLSDGDEASKFGDMIAAAIRATPPEDGG